MAASRWKDKAINAGFWLAALIITGILFGIVGYIFVKGFSSISLEFLLEPPRRAGKEGGISTTIVSTLYLAFLSLLLAVPIGVGSAIYLEEYARSTSKFAKLVKLTSVPLA